MQDDDFISNCNIALLVLMSFCLLLDLWPLTEVAEGGLHYLEKHRNKRKSKSARGRSCVPEPLAVPESRANRELVYMPVVAVGSKASSLSPAQEAVGSDNVAPEALTYQQSASFDWGDGLSGTLKSTGEEGPSFVIYI